MAEIWGLLARFDDSEALVEAAQKAHAAGYRDIDAYTPMPVEGLAEAMGAGHTKIPLMVFCGGVFGATLGYLFQFWVNVVDYPINVGGRPHNSWVAFLPVTFELTVLFAALTAVLTMLLFNGLPRPHHPLFGVPEFELASQSGFFLCIEATDPHFHPVEVRQFLAGLSASQIMDVPACE